MQLIEEAVLDAYTEEEQAAGLLTMIWRRRWRWGLNLVRINVCKIGASESA
jgi:hypothetical protein